MEYSRIFPPAPSKVFFVGIGGIGMSGLAQLMAAKGYRIYGSDRGLDEPGKAELYNCLIQQGIELFPQDGSGIAVSSPDAIVVSTAVEDGNPDIVAAKGIPILHRAFALSKTIESCNIPLIAVAGSCGKTSVTGWIASALHSLGERVLVVNGGYYAGDTTPPYPGNFMMDEHPQWAIAEIDESDRSISEFSPNYGILLNVGNDHYGEDELRQVFAAFLSRCRNGAVTSVELRQLAAGIKCPLGLFDTKPSDPSAVFPTDYSMAPDGIRFTANGFGEVRSSQSGRHSASNACAVLALLKTLGLKYTDAQLAASIATFPGIRQRFEVMGKNADGIPLVNDYAHNPEKIEAAISTAHDRFGGPIVAFFQPHGFAPLGFMREKLLDTLAQVLQPGDSFCMLPVFYAGGTAAFTPTSEDLIAELKQKHICKDGVALFALPREKAKTAFDAAPDAKAIIVMGARDSSLRPWTATL
ncbi:MAG: hypothetical protein IJS15_14605 [Victivallales bacterium]|nr:hypothetical protein [Victivallales bacterium]